MDSAGKSVTKTIQVNVTPHPASHAKVTAGGAVVATDKGSVITVPPGGAPPNTAITVTEQTQDQVTAETGIDWGMLNVTFLGAQTLQSSAAFSTTLTVVSAGYGNRVQPKQVIVNYHILPDLDGDGIGELTAINTASKGPNNTIISDPLPNAVLQSSTALVGTAATQAPAAAISGPPGTVIKLQVAGFNPLSALGNVAIFHSAVNGQEIKIPSAILIDRNNPSQQTLQTVIPPLPAGAATLVLRNEDTQSTTEPLNVTITPAAPLSKPAAQIVDDTLATALQGLQVISAAAAGGGALDFVHSADATITKTKELRVDLQQIAKAPTAAEKQMMTDLAIMFENAHIVDGITPLLKLQASRELGLCDNETLFFAGMGVYAAIGAYWSASV